MPQSDNKDLLNRSPDDAYEETQDVEEHINRMADEGGGVVDQNYPAGIPIARNSLLGMDDPTDSTTGDARSTRPRD